MSRYRKPEQHRIEISQGDWLLVRKHLTAGEERDAQTHLLKSVRAGEKPEMDWKQIGVSMIVSYLLDWSIKDVNEQPIPVRDEPYEKVAAALLNLPNEDLEEIRQAVEAHDVAMRLEREHQKKASDGASVPSPTSASAA